MQEMSDLDLLADRLAAAVGPGHVLRDRDVVAGYGTDWTRRYTGSASLVARPANTAEVQKVVTACRAAGFPIVPQGGNTGLVGGGVPRNGEVVVSLQRLARLEAVDVAASQVTVGAGTTLAQLQSHVASAGLHVGLDLAARDNATVGGLVATNAGGERVIRFGTARSQVAGLEAVLADGSIISTLHGLPKDNTGYDLASLMAGSEGTLGIITSVRWRLQPVLPAVATAVVALPDTAAAVAVLTRLRSRLPSLECAELFYEDGLRLVLDHLGIRQPFADFHPAYLLVECADQVQREDELTHVLAESPEVHDAVVAADASSRRALRQLRDAHAESIAASGVALKLDVAVPVAALAAFEVEVRAVVAVVAPHARVVLFGHINEGNFHVNILGAAEQATLVTDKVLRLVAQFSGSISAEHGVGVAKVDWLALSRSQAQISAMRSIKSALDPAGMFNPGVIFPA